MGKNGRTMILLFCVNIKECTADNIHHCSFCTMQWNHPQCTDHHLQGQQEQDVSHLDTQEIGSHGNKIKYHNHESWNPTPWRTYHSSKWEKMHAFSTIDSNVKINLIATREKNVWWFLSLPWHHNGKKNPKSFSLETEITMLRMSPNASLSTCFYFSHGD